MILDADGFIVAADPDLSKTNIEASGGCPGHDAILAVAAHGNNAASMTFEPVNR